MKQQIKIHFLIAIFLLGHAHISAQELAPSKGAYKPGEDVVISFSGGPGNAKDWVGIYNEGQTPGDVNSTDYKYVDGKTSGELVFDPLPVGKYEAHLLENDGYEILASTTFEVSDEVDVPKVSLSKAEYEIGEVIEISFSGGPGNKLDWIGVYQEGQTPGEVSSTDFEYVGGKTSGSFVFDSLPVGKYEAHLFEDDSYDILATESFNIKEAPVANKAPVVVDRSLEVNEEGSVSITLTGSDEDGDDLSFTVLSQPKNGALSGTAPNLTYSPKANYSGSDSFTFKASDGKADSNTATVTITVAEKVEEVQVSMSKNAYEIGELIEVNFSGGPGNAKDWLAIYGAAYDQPIEGFVNSFAYVDGTQNGITGKKSGTVYFKNGLPQGTYKVSLLENASSKILATAVFEIKPAEVKIQLSKIEYEPGEEIEISFSGGPGNKLDWIGVYQEGQQEISLWWYVDGTKDGNVGKASGVITVQLDLAVGSYKVSLLENNEAKILATASFNIKEAAVVNKAPVVMDRSLEVNEEGSVSITLTGSDEDGDDLTFTVVSQPKNGALSGTAPNLTYNPKANYSGSDSFTFKANDGSGDSKTATIMINVIKQVADKVKLTLSKAAYDEGEQIEISYSGGPGNAKDWGGIYKEGQKPGNYDSVQLLYLNGKTSGELIFDPLPSGKYEVHLFADDSYQKLYTAHFNVRSPLGSPLVTTSKSIYDFKETIIISYAAGPGNQKDWIGLHEEGKKGNRPIFESGPLKGKKSGTLEWDVTLEKGKKYNVVLYKNYSYNVIATAEFSISTKNIAAPVARSQKLNARAGKAYRVKLEGSDADGDAITYRIVAQPKHGTLSGTAPNLIYTSNTDYAGSDSFTYVANDGDLNSEIATVDFDINNSKPVARSQKLNARAGKAYRVKLEGSDTDGDAITYRIVAQPKHGTLSGTAPNLIYTSNTDYAGSDSFTYVANDGDLNSEIATVDFDINNNKPKKWTLLVFNPGDSNLSHGQLVRAKEFQRLGSNNNVNVIIQSDYHKNDPSFTKDIVSQYDDDYDNVSNGVTRIVVGENVNKNVPRTTPVVERLPEGSRSENRMDDPQVFGEFLDWGMLNYPAERYALLLIDHGGSFYGFGGDEQDGLGGANPLKLREFRKEIQRSLDSAGVEKFDFVYFDACLMGATEVLDAFDGLCDVLYGNVEVSWSTQFRERLKYIETLLNNPDIDNIELAKIEVGNFQLHMSIGVHCAYDMLKYGAFKIAFNKFSIDLLTEAKNMNSIISVARRNTTPYWKLKIEDFKSPSDFIDLAHFAEILSKNAVGELKGSSVALLNSINDMIISKKTGSKRPKVAGLNIYHPVNGLHANKIYSWDDTDFAKGTGGNWSKYLRQVNSVSQFESDQTEFVLNSNGELVARNAEFGMAESGLMSASVSRPIEIGFELKSADKAYDYFINLVSNRETDDPNQFVYLGELHRGLIDGKKKHQYNWDTRLPVLSLEGGGAKAPPVGSVGVDRKELIGEMPLYLGGWWSELSDDLMISYADYQGPGEEEKTHLILMTKYLEGGAGILESIILDSSLENKPPDGAGESENQVAPVGVDFEFEPGAKLWPVYYMDELDSENPGEWKPYFTWFKDGYIKIPENGKDGIVINWVGVEPGDYRAEVQVSDFYGNLSEELKFDIRVEGDLKGLPGLVLTLEGARVVLSWGMEDGGDEAILQWADGLGGEWVDVPSSDLGFGGAGRLYKENANDETKFYRLIKK